MRKKLQKGELNVEQKKISIIIPVYNTKTYIKKCILSALQQTYENIEVIVIDDGSNQETQDELKAVEQLVEDKRLKIIFKKHEGCAQARNFGLKQATGDYIFWLDSDDSLSPRTLEATIEVMDSENADMVRIDFTTDKLGIVTMDQMAYMRLLIDDHLKSYLTASLMKKDVLKGINFPTGNLVEDYAVYPEICMNCKKITLLRRTSLYLYTRNRPGSLTHSSAIKLPGLYPRMVSAEERYNVFRGQYPLECENVLAQFTNYACMVYLLSLREHGETAKDYREKALSLLKNHKIAILQSSKISKFRKREVKAICSTSVTCYFYLFMHDIKRMAYGVKGAR